MLKPTSLAARPVALVIVVFAVNATATATAVWPQFRGPGGQGVSSERGLPIKWGPRENLVWKTALPGAGASSPVVVGERAFLTCYSGKAEQLKRQVVCVNLGDGSIRWTKEVKSRLPEQETIREGHGYASSTPAVDADRLFVFFGKSGVFAFDHEGKQLWHADVGDRLNGWGSAASPVLHKDLVIVNASVESDSLVALDRNSGKEVWRAQGIRESWATPLLLQLPDGRTELVVPIFRKLLGVDPDTGVQLWSCDTEINWYMVPSLAAHEGVIYCIGGRSGNGLAVRAGGKGNVTATHTVWTIRKGSNVSSPIYHDGRVYWMNDSQGIAHAVEAATGKLLYEERVPAAGQTYASPVVADGKLYYVARGGKTCVLAAGPEYQLLAVNELEERGMFNATPAIAGGRLLIRSDRFLYCVGTK